MTYSVVIKKEVKEDIINATDYYKNINIDLAKRFLDQIREVKKHILKSPKAYQIKYEQVRTVLLKNFPYQLHY